MKNLKEIYRIDVCCHSTYHCRSVHLRVQHFSGHKMYMVILALSFLSNSVSFPMLCMLGCLLPSFSVVCLWWFYLNAVILNWNYGNITDYGNVVEFNSFINQIRKSNLHCNTHKSIKISHDSKDLTQSIIHNWFDLTWFY